MLLMHNKEDLTRDQDIKDKFYWVDFELDNREVQQKICKEDQQVNPSNKRIFFDRI
jgi:hypothetical protein